MRRRKIVSFVDMPSESFKTKIWTTDRRKPSTIYFEYASFIDPINGCGSSSEDMSRLRHYIHKETTRMINACDLFNTNFIVNFEVPEKRIGNGKRTYLLIQIFLKCKDEELLSRQFNEFDDALYDEVIGMEHKIFDMLTEMGYSVARSRR